MNIHKGLTDQFGLQDPELSGVDQVYGSLDAAPYTFGIVASRFNGELTAALVKTAIATLKQHGARAGAIHLIWVPGAFEIPTLLEQCATRRGYQALIALGAVLEGDTPHATAINEAVTRSINEIARNHCVPVIDGVVVARTLEQAVERCLSGANSRGAYAAKAAIEMANVMRALKG